MKNLASDLRILLISSVSPAAGGGSAAYFRCLGNELILKGHAVTGLSRVHLDLKKNLTFWKTDFPGEFRVLSFDGWSCNLVKPSAASLPLLRTIPHLMWRRGLQSVAIASFQAAFAKRIERRIPQSFDVVHYVGAGAEMMGFSALKLAKAHNAIFTVTPFVHPGEWADGSIDIRLYNQADAVFVCTEIERRHLIASGVITDRLRKVPMAPSGMVPADGQAFRKRFELGNRPLVLFMARKHRYKGYHVLREAMGLVLSSFPEAVLVAAGPDGERPYPELPGRNVLDLGELTPNPQDIQTKADAFAACDVFCMPSAAEAFGLVYAEAWHYRKPVIAGPAPALTELIEDGSDGYRAEQNATQIAQKIMTILADPNFGPAMGQRGYEKQQRLYTWPAVIESHMANWRDASATHFPKIPTHTG